MERRERFLAALEGSPVDRPPLWLMRQAGRYLPEYRATRKEHGFWDVCKNPELSTKVALEPLRLFPLDAAIVFSDILVIPEALGIGVRFGPGEGPKVERPLRTEADLDAWTLKGMAERLAYVPNAVRHLKQTLAGSHGLIGFAGAPWTLFAYTVEGGGSDDFIEPRRLLHTNPRLAERALTILADEVASLLEAECDAGADVVQLFDTWGGLLPRDEYLRFAVPAIRRITDRLHAKGRKVLLFVKAGHHLLPVLSETGADGFSLDWRVDFAEARARFPNSILQGNIDPVLLFAGEKAVREKTRALLEQIKSSGSTRNIVNLGHGILPGTPVEAVGALCDEVVRG